MLLTFVLNVSLYLANTLLGVWLFFVSSGPVFLLAAGCENSEDSSLILSQMADSQDSSESG